MLCILACRAQGTFYENLKFYYKVLYVYQKSTKTIKTQTSVKTQLLQNQSVASCDKLFLPIGEQCLISMPNIGMRRIRIFSSNFILLNSNWKLLWPGNNCCRVWTGINKIDRQYPNNVTLLYCWRELCSRCLCYLIHHQLPTISKDVLQNAWWVIKDVVS